MNMLLKYASFRALQRGLITKNKASLSLELVQFVYSLQRIFLHQFIYESARLNEAELIKRQKSKAPKGSKRHPYRVNPTQIFLRQENELKMTKTEDCINGMKLIRQTNGHIKGRM